MSGMQQDELDDISLSYLQQFFHLPLIHVAKHLNVSLTALKRVCRKQGLPRWPYRQIKSIESEISALQGKCQSKPPLAAGELESCRAQITGLAQKKALIVRSAVKGVDPIVRGAIYLTDISGVNEEELFDHALLPQLVAALKTVKKRKKMRGFSLGDILDAVRHNGVMPAEITNVSPAGSAGHVQSSKLDSRRSGPSQLLLPPVEGLKKRLARGRSADAGRGHRGRRTRRDSSSEEDSEYDNDDEIAQPRASPTTRWAPPSRRGRLPPQQMSQLPPAAATVAEARILFCPTAPATRSSEELLLLRIGGDYGHFDEDGEKAGAVPLQPQPPRRRQRERRLAQPKSKEAQLEHAEEVFRKLIWRSSLRGITAVTPHSHWDAAGELLPRNELPAPKRARCDSWSGGEDACLTPLSRKKATLNNFSPTTASTDSGWTSGEDTSSLRAFGGSGMSHVDSQSSFEATTAHVQPQQQQQEPRQQQSQPQHQLLPKRELPSALDLFSESPGSSSSIATANCSGGLDGGADVCGWVETAEMAAMFEHNFAANGSGTEFLWEPSAGDGEAPVAAAAAVAASPPPAESLYLASSGAMPGLLLMPLPWGDF